MNLNTKKRVPRKNKNTSNVNNSTNNSTNSTNNMNSYDSDDSTESVESIVFNVEQTTLTKRYQVKYEEHDRNGINIGKSIINAQFEELKHNGTSIIYPNQDVTASKIIETFRNRNVVNIMVIAKTQSGKTGTMCATIQKFMNTTEESMIIPKDNIFIITGLSSCEWMKQTKERLPECIEKNVCHRDGLLTTFIDKIKDKKNILIIMDEIQIASKYQQTIYKTFYSSNIFNGNNLYRDDIKILEFTATPDGTIYDLNLWKEGAKKILAPPAPLYTSSYNIYEADNMKQYRNLSADEDYESYYEELKKDVDSYDTPMYHIIRTHGGERQNIIRSRLHKYFSPHEYSYEYYDGQSKKEENLIDLNNILKNPPAKHTFILIKEMLRCAKTLYKKYIGVVYERYSVNTLDSVIVQGLAGRLTGYDYNKKSICYTNVDTIIQYEQLWKSEFNDKSIKWKVSKKPTFNHLDIYDPDKVASILEPDLPFKRVPVIIPLENTEEDNLIYTYKGRSKDILNAKKLFIQERVFSLGCHDESSDYHKLFNFMKKFKCKQITIPRSSDNYKRHITDSIKKAEQNKPFYLAFTPKEKEQSVWEAFISDPETGFGPRCISIIVWSKNPEVY